MVERVRNGGFETGDYTDWTKSTPGPSISSINSQSGSYNSYTYISINGGSGGFGSYVYQSINLTGVDKISFYFLNDVNFVGGGGMTMTVYCDIDRDDSYEWSESDPQYDTYQYIEVDTSAISGVHDVEFGFVGGWNQAEFTIANRFDSISAVGTSLAQINISDAWKEVDTSGCKINIGDTWKEVVSIKQNIGDTWKTVF